jgi:hypothetical protein
MPLDLSSVRAKLAHSAKHAQSVRDEVAAWTQRNPYSIVQKVNSNSTRYAITIRVNEPAPLYQWSLMIADSIHSLRCCLDYLVYAIACHEALPKPPSYEGRLQFPITQSKTEFEAALVRRKQLGAISGPVRAAIEFYQPYNRPHPDLPPLLSILQEFSNWDKHKLLRLGLQCVAQGEVGMDFRGADPPILDGDYDFAPSSTPEIEDGAEVFSMTFRRPTPNMRFDRTVFYAVVAMRHSKRDPAGPTGSDLTDFAALLNFLSTEVREIIYEVSAKVC